MAGQRQRLLGAEHARAGAEFGLALLIVEPGVAAGDEQEGLVAGAHRQRLGDPARRDAERGGGGGDRRGALSPSIRRRSGAWAASQARTDSRLMRFASSGIAQSRPVSAGR